MYVCHTSSTACVDVCSAPRHSGTTTTRANTPANDQSLTRHTSLNALRHTTCHSSTKMSSSTLTNDSSPVQIYAVCKTYVQLYALRHLSSVARLISCISSYTHNHPSITNTEVAFKEHRRLTLRRARRATAQSPLSASSSVVHDGLLAEVDQLQSKLVVVQRTLNRVLEERDSARAEVREWQSYQANTAASENELQRQLQRIRQREAETAPISVAPPPVAASQQRLTIYFPSQRP